MIASETVQEVIQHIGESIGDISLSTFELGQISITDREVLQQYINIIKSHDPEYPFTVEMFINDFYARQGPVNHSIRLDDEEFSFIILYSLHPTTLQIDNILEVNTELYEDGVQSIFPEYQRIQF